MQFDKLEFIVMDRLLNKAGQLDEELKLHRTSKEAKQAPMKFEKNAAKTKKGQLRWQDPW